MDIASTLEKSVADIRQSLPAMTVDQLHALHAAEQAGKQRVTLINAIEERLGEIANATRAEQDKPVDMSQIDEAGAVSTATPPTDAPAWLSPEYTGPLDIAQAEARNRILAAQSVA